MTQNLSSAARALRNQLRADPAFKELLDSLPELQSLRFKPSGAGSPEEQGARWHYLSGRHDERETVLQVLLANP